ncbi:MAG: hypothetical protein MI725_14340 [Pirellulales bacterium]|nr:hypothetical protein [Pirellulales bacterium]
MRCQTQLVFTAGLYSVICLVCIGCGKAIEEQTVSAAVPETPAAEHPEEEKAPVELPDQITADQQTEAKPVEKPVELAFEPPFPERVDLFQAPKRQGKGLLRSEQSGTSIELLGFVNVDQQRVLLDVNGLVAPFAEGDKHFGIEVVSIQPPKVVLQRGRQRWQTALEN